MSSDPGERKVRKYKKLNSARVVRSVDHRLRAAHAACQKFVDPSRGLSGPPMLPFFILIYNIRQHT